MAVFFFFLTIKCGETRIYFYFSVVVISPQILKTKQTKKDYLLIDDIIIQILILLLSFIINDYKSFNNYRPRDINYS